MTAFEIHLNGRKMCTAGINEAGVVVPTITWASRGTNKNDEDLEFRVGGLISRTKTHVDWFHRMLKTGDEVKIVVVETKKVDRPKKKRRESKAARVKREQKYLEKKAAEYGWKLSKQ